MPLSENLNDWLDATIGERFRSTDLDVEASTRSFFRIETDDSSRVAMASPPTTERNDAFVTLTKIFRDHGVTTPTVLASDDERGFFLLEDLGQRRFDDVYRDFETPGCAPNLEAVLERSIETIHHIQMIPSHYFDDYTDARLSDELAIFDDWLIEQCLAQTDRLGERFEGELIDGIRAVPVRPLHRDFHCRNLIWRDDDVGVVDFQDALNGPITYDLASFCCDCYHTFDEPIVETWRQRFRTNFWQSIDAETFERAFDYTAIQRQLKACGIFIRLALRDGRETHLHHISPVLGRIATRAAKYNALTGLSDSVVEVGRAWAQSSFRRS